ncbi:hypothetical protein KJA13_04380 [Patescibacteria group bacterium]|nr:hypothetical protein [Patescibacteria group bacterium]
MKKTFPGYFKLSEKQFKSLWNSCIFTFDASVLLNLYRYSDKTREEFIRILTLPKIKERIWLSHQASSECLKNRLNVIEKQLKSHELIFKSLNQIEQDFKDRRKRHLIREDTMEDLSEIFKEIRKELNASKKKYKKLLSDDKIIRKISSLFKSKVGSPYSSKDLKKIYREGKERYEEKVPPGYKDRKEKRGNRKYGDLVMWKQMIDKAASENKGVILITDEKEEDWWLISQNQIIGPRPELINEFVEKTKMSFYMYRLDNFMELAGKYVKIKKKVRKQALKEIKERSEYDRPDTGVFRLDRISDAGVGVISPDRGFERIYDTGVSGIRGEDITRAFRPGDLGIAGSGAIYPSGEQFFCPFCRREVTRELHNKRKSSLDRTMECPYCKKKFNIDDALELRDLLSSP